MKNREIKYRFYDKRVKRMYYPNPLQMAKFFEAYATDKYKDILVPMQATGIFDNTKFKNLSPEQQNKWLENNKKEDWPGIEIYEGDVTALRYDKERTEYGVVSYYRAGFQKSGTALSSYQKLTTIVGNLFEGYPSEAKWAVDFHLREFKEIESEG